MGAVKLRGAAKTDIGLRRQTNEDAFAFLPDLALFVVADGMGGQGGGQTASRLAVEAIQESFESTKDEDLTPIPDERGNRSLAGRRLLIAFTEANARVIEAGTTDPRLAQMGAAVAALAIDTTSNQVAISHVGDTRVYRIRDNEVEQLTQDHTVVQRLLSEGRITPDDVPFYPDRHALTRALGCDPVVRPTLRLEELLAGDVLLVCSDGVHNAVASDQIGDIVRQAAHLDEACSRLIDLANAQGGQDNSTVLAVALEGNDPGAPPTA
jgi:protein phosphatase